MRPFPIIPLPLMIPICIGLLILVILKDRKIIHIACILLLFIINLRFMIPGESSSISENNLDVLFVVDNTISMIAEDYNGNKPRIEGVKEDCKKIIQELNGARFSVIKFNNYAEVLVPFTKDTFTAYESIEILEPPEKLYARGTTLNTPKKQILESLKDSYDKSPNRLRILIFISDGEITDSSSLESYSSLKKYTSDGIVLGYGTTTGGNMKNTSRYSDQEDVNNYITDYATGKKAVSKIDENNLRKIASDLGIPYIHMNNSSNIDTKLADIKSKMSYEMTYNNKTTYYDIYYIFVFPLLVLLAIEFKTVRRSTK